MKKFSIDYSFIFFLAVLFFSPKQKILLMLIISLFLHEIGHLLMVWLTKYKTTKIKVSIFGFFMELETTKVTFLKDFLVFSGGILVNLFLYIFVPNQDMKEVNLFLIFINIIPLYPLDGYNLLKSFLEFLIPHFYAIRISIFSSFVLNLILLILGILYKVDLYLVFSLVYLLYLTIKIIKNLKIIDYQFILKKQQEHFDYPLREITFKEDYEKYLYKYAKITMKVGEKCISERELLALKYKI